MEHTIVGYFLQFEIMKNLVEMASSTLGFNASSIIAFIIFLTASLILLLIAATIGGLGTFAERKISADMQMRPGPNRVGPYGIVQMVADFIKLFLKEDIVPVNADRFLFYIAPILAIVGVLGTFAVLPISSGLIISDLNVALFYAVGISSLVGLGIFLGGYASNSKWSMLGGMRGAAQIVSYEIPVILSMFTVILFAGGLSFGAILENQSGGPIGWYLFHNPFTFIAFFVYFIGILAETNRAPFDLPESESELVSGYNTEFTGMRYAFFALAEYMEVFVVAAFASALFLGGYKIPFNIGGDSLIGQVLQAGMFFTKVALIYYVVIWIRWTLPRMRVDNLMTLCWKYLTPIAFFNLIGSAVWIYYFGNKSMWNLIFS